MGQSVRVYDKFQYFFEDFDCEVCLHYQGKSRYLRYGCEQAACCLAEKADALAHGRMKRKRGWFR